MDRLFFEGDPELKHHRLKQHAEADIRHELFYEDAQNSIKQKPVYLGNPFDRWRFILSFLVPVLVICVLGWRAFNMQVVHGQEFQQQAENNRLRSTPIWPKRGIIRDRNGVVLAENEPRFQLLLYVDELPKRDDTRLEVITQVARLLGLPSAELQAQVDGATHRDDVLFLADQLNYEQAMQVAIALPQLSGIRLEVRSKRRYPQSSQTESLSHVLGYVGKLTQDEYAQNKDKGYLRADEIGKTGVERSYESLLRGMIGEDVSEVDARGRVKAKLGQTQAEDGKDVWLTIDLELQKAAERALRSEMELTHKKRGAIVAMDPRDGSILALVSWPAYDNNQFAGAVSSTVYQALVSNPDQPLYPRAWAGVYPSGSTVKIVVSLAALQEKIITEATTVLSNGGLRIGQWFFPDWKAGGHGVTNVRRAIAWSVNTFFYTIGGGYESFVGMGVDTLTAWMRKFGLGQKTGVDLPGENAGFVPSKDWKQETKGERWFVGDTYNLSIGQGDLLVTPLQVANYTSAIANGGSLIAPHVYKGSGDRGSEAVVTSSIRVAQLGDAHNVTVVQQGMRDCVVTGSCRALNVLNFPVAGKTGTAQWSSTKDTHAWFTSFAPYNKAEVVVTVLVEEGGEGSSVAVPVAKEVLQAWWDLRTRRQGQF